MKQKGITHAARFAGDANKRKKPPRVILSYIKISATKMEERFTLLNDIEIAITTRNMGALPGLYKQIDLLAPEQRDAMRNKLRKELG